MTTSQAAARLVSIAFAVLIFAGPGAPSAQALAKSGPQLAFIDGFELRTIGADGRRERTIAHGEAGPVTVVELNQPFAPAWSPDGKAIAWSQTTWAHYARVAESHLRLARADGSNDTTLLSIPGFIEEVRWSPDGRRLAFVLRLPNPVVSAATWTDYGDRLDIYLINKDGSGLRPIAPLHAAAVRGLDFSPDGSNLVFASDAQGLPGIYTIALDGVSVPTRLTPLDITGKDPRWSPDGTRIAFTGLPSMPDSNLTNVCPSLWTINSNGSALRKLDATTWDPPSWSADGRWLAYSGASGIRTIRVDGSIKRTLTSAEDYKPIWSRTGRIAFVREMRADACCERALWVMDADGSNARRISAASEVTSGIAWSR